MYHIVSIVLNQATTHLIIAVIMTIVYKRESSTLGCKFTINVTSIDWLFCFLCSPQYMMMLLFLNSFILPQVFVLKQ